MIEDKVLKLKERPLNRTEWAVIDSIVEEVRKQYRKTPIQLRGESIQVSLAPAFKARYISRTYRDIRKAVDLIKWALQDIFAGCVPTIIYADADAVTIDRVLLKLTISQDISFDDFLRLYNSLSVDLEDWSYGVAELEKAKEETQK